LRCLERDPSRRPQSAYAVFGALPGGDPLAAAVAAGETPSPELVANAGVEGSVRPLYAGLLVLIAVASLLGVSAIQTPLFRKMGKPPDLLSVRADEIVTRLTREAPPKYTLDGMRYAPKPDTAPAVQFWKRWSPMPYVPSDLHAPRAGLQDPPQAYPGSATSLLDLQGRLIALDALRPDSLASAPPRTADWGAAVLDAAGRDPDHVVAVTPPSGFLVRADSVRAWRLSDSTAPETTLVAAALRGRVVRVETYAKGQPLGRLAVVAHDPAPTVQVWVQVLLFAVVPLIGSIFLARHNLRSRRGDLRGAMAVGISTAVIYLLAHLFSGNLGEIGLLSILLGGTGGAPLGHALVHGVTMALAYLAIEPYVRRLWPSVLVSWARLVAGRLRDPIIGRDVLIGVAFGSVAALIGLGMQVLERRLGFPIDPPSLSGFLLETMTHPPSLLANVCMALAVGILRATLFFTILVIFRFVLRKNVLAAIATILCFIFALSDLSSKALGFDLLATAVIWTAGTMMALRFGYVATLVSLFTGLFVESEAFSLDFSSWVAPQTAFAWAIVLALVAYGFLTAVAGHSLFRDPLSDPVATAVRPKRAL
jgi:serine/threonine-protein kinase